MTIPQPAAFEEISSAPTVEVNVDMAEVGPTVTVTHSDTSVERSSDFPCGACGDSEISAPSHTEPHGPPNSSSGGYHNVY